jgi:hypothetical protein
MHRLFALIVLLLPALALAYDPPPFDPARRLVVVEPDAAVPGARAEADAALAATTVRIFGVITSMAQDPRHRGLRWANETEAADRAPADAAAEVEAATRVATAGDGRGAGRGARGRDRRDDR